MGSSLSRIPKSSTSFFNLINTEEKAYWLGFIYADGSMIKRPRGKYITVIDISEKDSIHLQKFADIFNKQVKPFTHPKGSKLVRLIIYNKKLFIALLQKGLKPNKVHQDITQVFDCIPKDLLHHFIRGIFDGDGCITITQDGLPHVSFAGSYYTIQEIETILTSHLTIRTNKINPIKNSFQVAWAGHRQATQIKDWMYNQSSIYLERKYNLFK